MIDFDDLNHNFVIYLAGLTSMSIFLLGTVGRDMGFHNLVGIVGFILVRRMVWLPDKG